jgi:hypothetical protein
MMIFLIIAKINDRNLTGFRELLGFDLQRQQGNHNGNSKTQ